MIIATVTVELPSNDPFSPELWVKEFARTITRLIASGHVDPGKIARDVPIVTIHRAGELYESYLEECIMPVPPPAPNGAPHEDGEEFA